jgi:hypothetical protein
MNPSLINASVLAASMSSNSLMATGVLKNPFMVPKKVVLTGTLAEASTKTYFYMDDACGLASQAGTVATGDTTGAVFVASGVTVTNIQKFLATHALIIGGYNFNSSDAAQLSNDLQTIFTSLDLNSSVNSLFSSLEVSNMQYNQNLLNIVDQPFVWTNQTALKILASAQPVDGGQTIFTFTFKVAAAVPYGKLDEFLEYEKIPSRSKN